MADFYSKKQHYDKNHRDSIAANVRPAIIETPSGATEHGAVVSINNQVRLVLTETDARRIALDLANLILNRKQNNVPR